MSVQTKQKKIQTKHGYLLTKRDWSNNRAVLSLFNENNKELFSVQLDNSGASNIAKMIRRACIDTDDGTKWVQFSYKNSRNTHCGKVIIKITRICTDNDALFNVDVEVVTLHDFGLLECVHFNNTRVPSEHLFPIASIMDMNTTGSTVDKNLEFNCIIASDIDMYSCDAGNVMSTITGFKIAPAEVSGIGTKLFSAPIALNENTIKTMQADLAKINEILKSIPEDSEQYRELMSIRGFIQLNLDTYKLQKNLDTTNNETEIKAIEQDMTTATKTNPLFSNTVLSYFYCLLQRIDLLVALAYL